MVLDNTSELVAKLEGFSRESDLARRGTYECAGRDAYYEINPLKELWKMFYKVYVEIPLRRYFEKIKKREYL